MRSHIAIAEFVSKTVSAGVVHVELGFEPDFWILLSNIDGTNPDILLGANASELPLSWTTSLSLLLTGSTGVVTRDTSGMSIYAGGETIGSSENTNTDPKHVTVDGAAAEAGHITAPGVSIPADHQAAGGKNILIAFRREK